MTIRKVTAGNSKFLAAAKQVFNAPIFRTLSEMMNGPNPEQACHEYLSARGLATDPIAFLAARRPTVRKSYTRRRDDVQRSETRGWNQ